MQIAVLWGTGGWALKYEFAREKNSAYDTMQSIILQFVPSKCVNYWPKRVDFVWVMSRKIELNILVFYIGRDWWVLSCLNIRNQYFPLDIFLDHLPNRLMALSPGPQVLTLRRMEL